MAASRRGPPGRRGGLPSDPNLKFVARFNDKCNYIEMTRTSLAVSDAVSDSQPRAMNGLSSYTGLRLASSSASRAAYQVGHTKIKSQGEGQTYMVKMKGALVVVLKAKFQNPKCSDRRQSSTAENAKRCVQQHGRDILLLLLFSHQLSNQGVRGQLLGP